MTRDENDESPSKSDVKFGPVRTKSLMYLRSATPWSRTGFFVSPSPWVFRLWWAIIAFVHVICIGTFALESWAYWRIPDTYAAVGFEMYDVIMPLSDFHVLSLVHGAIAAAHGLLLLQMVLGSLCFRRLTFFMWLPHAVVNREMHPTAPSSNDFGQQSTKLNAWLKGIGSTCSRLHENVFGRRGLLGIEGSHFALIYIIREVFETVLQSHQAYSMSQLVPHVAINRFFIFVIVLNCWSTPIIQHIFTHNPPLERLLCLVFDVALDFVSVVGIPMRLAVPYLKQYDFEYHDFPYALWYDDIWLVNMIHELQLVFISSWSDLASQVIFSVSLILSLQDIKCLLKSPSSLSASTHVAVHPKKCHEHEGRLASSASKTVAVDSGRFTTMSAKAMARINSFVPTQATSTRLKKIVHAFLALWGLLILILHVRVSFGAVPSHCIVMARPWFGTKSGCALMYVNCKTIQGATGNLEELATAMDTMDEATLTHLVVRHCNHVEIPPQLQSFPNLIGLKMYNSTLVSWAADAALAGRNHPKMLFLFMVDVNMTELPLGLQSREFPQQLLDIEFSGTNLSILPDDLDQKWPSEGLVVFERSAFTTVPKPLTRMALAYLAMAQNRITELPAELLANPSMINFWFSGNPIRTLPSSLTLSQNMGWLDLRFSELEAVPSWVDDAFFDHVLLTAGESPICRKLIEIGSNNGFATGDLAEAWKGYKRGRLSCKVASRASSITNYPYSLEPALDTKYSHVS